MSFLNFVYVYKNTGLKKNKNCSRKTFSLITQKIHMVDIESFYNNTSKCHNVTFQFRN